jgi:starch synthase
MEFYGQVSAMKAGIVSADRVTTVSEKYAREIQTEALGYGLNGVLADRQGQLFGIVNGIDNTVWDPSTDPNLPFRYSADTLREGKAGCKRALCRSVGLSISNDTMLIGMVTRLVELKGIDLLAECMPALMERKLGLVLLGSGRDAYHLAAQQWVKKWPGQFACELRFDPVTAHRIYAGADAFLMPSEVEPCGLSQLYSMRYGTLPIVRATGGLDDTVEDLDATGRTGSGFKFGAQTPEDLLDAIDRALALYAKPKAFLTAQRRAMAIDHSWDLSARKYVGLYRDLLEER